MTRFSNGRAAQRPRGRKLSLEQLDRRELLSATPLLASTIEARTLDGTGNNVDQAEWGSTDEQLLRFAAADYGDGIAAPAGADRPSARTISNEIAALSPDALPSDRQMSAFVYVWGQFLDHDIDFTDTQGMGGEAFDIAVPSGDPFFDPAGDGDHVMPLIRSQYDTATGQSLDSPRQQINGITAWVDGSMIYGSDEATSASLRTFSGGHLTMSEGDLLPADEEGNFLAGDVRASENIELTSMHTLFVREHNQWADRIARANPDVSDEEIFQQARAIVIAEIQAITYNEFLPALLGRGALSRYEGYDPAVNPGIANEFSTAAYRLGHSLVNDDVEFFGNDGRAARDEVELREAFFNPDLLRETGIDSILKYSASSQSQELDNQIVDGLRNFLFGEPGQGGLDLAAMNIQRGRDHGLADYNAVREAYGLERVTEFADITSNEELQATLAELYGDVDNIDLWVGLLAEDHLSGSSVGELTSAILVDQFERLRDGDRLWYQNVFSRADVRTIERTSLADIIERNTEVRGLQDNVFFMRATIEGQVFDDRSGDGRLGRREAGVAGITVELLDDEGEVIDTAVTDRRGRYRFTSMSETGDYQVRVALDGGTTATGPAVVDVLVQSGAARVGNVNFGIRRGRPARADAVADMDDQDPRRPRRERLVDEALAALSPPRPGRPM